MYVCKTFDIPLYRCKLKFFIVNHIPTKVKVLEKVYNIKVTDYDYEDSGGLEFMAEIDDTFTYFIIIRSTAIKHYHISHEIQHFVDDVDKTMSLDGSEARAYLNGHITQVIQDFLKSKNIEVE